MNSHQPSHAPGATTPETVLHGSGLRALHWINAVSILVLIPSGLAIYNAAPFYPIVFPAWITLGGSLSGALLWHFAAMWLLMVTLTSYVVVRIILRRGGPKLTPIRARAVLLDSRRAVTFRLAHEDGVYNSIQRVVYIGIAVVLVIAVLSGLVLWKPVQFQGFASLLGGYEAARRVHFWAMVATAGFLALHLVMVALMPRTLLTMVFGLTIGPNPSSRVATFGERDGR